MRLNNVGVTRPTSATAPTYSGLRAVYIAVICLTILCSSNVVIGAPQHCVGECRPLFKQYTEILDAVFPIASDGDPYLVLRFMPTGQTEFQIVVNVRAEGSYEVLKYSLPRDAEPIGIQMMRLRTAHPNDSSTELAKYIKTEQKTISLNSTTISKLLGELKLLKIPAEVSQDIVVDATSYEFWYVARPACNVLHIAFSDADLGHDAKAHPLVRWMNRVRRAVDAAELQSK